MMVHFFDISIWNQVGPENRAYSREEVTPINKIFKTVMGVFLKLY